jgi:FMN phosphatase YigB (HAD superfamily)
MAYKSLLLDIDGTILRDRLLMEHVKDNCVSYVRSKLPQCKDPHETNRVLYLAHGHTARGLQRAFDMNVTDFNQKVYDAPLMNHLADVLSSKQFQEEAAELYELTHEGWNLKLFTNAPWIWASKVSLAIGDTVSVTCPGNPSDSPLKPEPEAYMFSQHHLNVFVDDSLKNLGTARYLANWQCVYFNEGPKEPNLWCPQVSSTWELCLLARSIDSLVERNNSLGLSKE